MVPAPQGRRKDLGAGNAGRDDGKGGLPGGCCLSYGIPPNTWATIRALR